MISRALSRASRPGRRWVALPLPLARAGALRPVTARAKDLGAACLFAVLAAAGCGIERPPEADALEPEEYRLWQGDWYEASSGSVEDNVYFRLEISGADQHGFGYQLEERTVPYGPNAEWSGERTAGSTIPCARAIPRRVSPSSCPPIRRTPTPASSRCVRAVRAHRDGARILGPTPPEASSSLDEPAGGAGSRSRRP